MRTALILCAVLNICSCYMPPLWDAFDTINRLDLIEPGYTSKDQIIKWYGEPELEDPDGKWIVYLGSTSKGSVGFGGYYGAGAFSETIDEKPWSITIRFDNNDIATCASLRDPIGLRAEQYESGQSLPGNPEIKLSREVGVYCPNADLGHSDAQIYIARIYDYGWYGKTRDPVRAWVWYSLSAGNGEASAVAAIKRLSDQLTTQQLELAYRQLESWTPGYCSNELLLGYDVVAKTNMPNESKYKQPTFVAIPSNHRDAGELLKYYWKSPAEPDNPKWLCHAADQSHPIAQRRLGLLYSQGSEGFPKDLSKAYIWYRLAACNGSMESLTDMKNIVEILDEEQYQEALVQYFDWKPGECENDIAQ